MDRQVPRMENREVAVRLLMAVVMMFVVPMTMSAQSYEELWKQEREASGKDLPKTQIEILEKIEKKAEKEKNYGQLLAAGLKRAGRQVAITPDSLEVEVARLEAKTEQYAATDPVLAAVCRTVLGKIYKVNYELGENREKRSREYFEMALSDADKLAQCKYTSFDPLVEKGDDSSIFDNDLLHVIGMEANRYDLLYDYYRKASNRKASCLMALADLREKRQEMSNKRYVARLDSLLDAYGDLDVAGDVAIERFNNMKGSATECYHYAEEAYQKYKSWTGINHLLNSMENMKTSCFEVSYGENRILPYQERTVRLNEVRNIGKLTMTVWKLKGTGETEYNLYNDRAIKETMQQIEGDPVQVTTREYSGVDPWVSVKDSIVLNSLRPGVYLFEMKADRERVAPRYQVGYVSDVYVIWEEQPANTIRYVVVSGTTGKPIPNASLKLTLGRSWDKNPKTKVLKTDSNGECTFTYEKDEPYKAYAWTDGDKASMASSVSSSFSCYNVSDNANYLRVYTDRSIYRPGQTVHVGVLSFLRHDHDQYEVRPASKVTVKLLDANMQKVAEKEVETDEFGKAAADFVLPSAGLTGNFTVQARDLTSGSATIKVEEYKRPTFELKFDDYKEKYANGDTVTVKAYAKTFAGVPVQGAKVKYSVTRRQALWCWWMPQSNDGDELLSDETTTDDEGAFYMRIPVILPKAAEVYEDGEDNPYWRWGLFYHFTARADVTDQGGESHGGTFTLPMGTKTTSLTSSLPKRALADDFKSVTFSYTNAAGERIEGKVRFAIDGKNFGGGKAFDANKPIEVGRLSSGKHTFTATCGDNQLTQKVVIFSVSDKSPVIETHDWFYTSDGTFPRDGKPVYIQFGSSDKNQHVVYSLFAGNKVLESGTLKHSNSLTTRTFTYQEEYGDGLTFTCAWVRNGRLYQHTTTIRKPEPDKRLLLKWKTFRDRLTPGQKEEWELTINTPDGKPADAQLMAAMYDKSLDQLYSHGWGLAISFMRSLASTNWLGLSSSDIGSKSSAYADYHYPGYMRYAKIANSYLSDLLERPMIVGYGRPMRLRGRAKASGARYEELDLLAAPMAEEMSANSAMLKKEVALADVAEEESTEDKAPEPEPTVRENLDETAFFYPQLRTDGQGNVSIVFTLPESLTTWRFISIAHDKEMNHGSLSGETVAQKKVMVSPNVPRFVRQGDRATIGTRLMSTEEKDVKGVARMELIDPQTNNVVFSKELPFNIKAQSTSSLVFDIDPAALDDRSLLIARISAQGDDFSDGEQHYLPVLSNMEQVLNTLPITIHGAGTKTFDLSKLFPEGTTNRSLTMEYTNHPSWLMIQALPFVGSIDERNAISLVSAYYANMLGETIMKSSPKIKETIEAWRDELSSELMQTEKGKESASLISALEKNQEVKELVLNETPWVLDSQAETRQKQDLIKFFDENLIKQRLESAMNYLKKLQNGDGSWSWWEGMRGSLYVTMNVTETLVRLNTMIGEQSNTKGMLKSAFKYMRKEIAKEVVELKKLEKKGFKNLRPSETAVDYLYTWALYGEKPTGSAKADIDYLVALLSKKTTELTIYGKAVSAVILAHNGYQKKAAEYMQSMKEYSVYTEEMGRYYDTKKAFYSWFDYRIPTEVAAIEALRRITPNDRQTVEEMQRWLLQEKRTQAWSTPINSVNAVYAFFGSDGVQKMTEQTGEATISLDGEPMEMSKSTAGLGYVRSELSPLTSQPSSLTIDKPDSDSSWGAVYAKFLQPVTEIENSSSQISVTREVIPLTSSSPSLKVGDRVKVRITIRAERDYDFVQVVDRRAACLEPVGQLSGYRYGYYCAPKDCSTNYYFDQMRKGKYVIETEYYVDRAGDYQSGSCTAQCAYAPEFYGRVKGEKVKVE